MTTNSKGRRIEIKDIHEVIALDDFTIIEAHEPEDVSKGGIIIPDTAKKSAFRGTVVCVGPGKRDNNGNYMPLGIEIGDVVIFRNFTGWKIAAIEGTEYFAIDSTERFAKIPKGKVEYIE